MRISDWSSDVCSSDLLSFRNDSASGLGEPLPSGTIRVYGPAGDAPAFLGEDRLEDTAVGEDVRLAIGRSFDVTATPRQTDFRHVGLTKGRTEERRVGKAVVGTCRSRWSRAH